MKSIKNNKRIALIALIVILFFFHLKSIAQNEIDIFFDSGFDSVNLKWLKINETTVIDSVLLTTQPYPFDNVSNVRLRFRRVVKTMYLINSEKRVPILNSFVILNKGGNIISFWLENERYSFWFGRGIDAIYISDFRKTDGGLELVFDEKKIQHSKKAVKFAPKRMYIKKGEFIKVRKRPRVRMKY
jgi:hypothetical protein